MDEDFDTIEVSEEEADEWYETMVKPMCEDEGYAWLTDEEFEESLKLRLEEGI